MSNALVRTLAVWTVCFVSSSIASANLIVDGSFESPNIATNSYEYAPTGANWTFSTGSGIGDGDAGGFGNNSPVPDGDQFAILQWDWFFSQSITLPSDGVYLLSYQEAGRWFFGEGNQLYDILLNDRVLHSDSTTTAQEFEPVSFSFLADAGTYDLSFVGKATSDQTAFFDAISLTPAAVPEPGSLALLALGGVGLAGGAWRNRRQHGNGMPSLLA